MLRGVNGGVFSFRLGSRIYIVMRKCLLDDMLFERIRPWHACGFAWWSEHWDTEGEYAA